MKHEKAGILKNGIMLQQKTKKQKYPHIKNERAKNPLSPMKS